MHISSQYADGALIICFYGELDHHTAAQVFRDSRMLLDKYLPRSCILDLSGLTFMDSSGVAFILRLRKILRLTGASLTLTCPAEQPGRVILASGLDRLVSVNYRESESVR